MASLLYMYVSGHPIVNDPLYNSPSWGPLRGKGGHCDVSHEEVDRLTADVVVDCLEHYSPLLIRLTALLLHVVLNE